MSARAAALVWFAFAGAGGVSVLVYMLGSLGRGGATPVRLALAGAAINALLLALVSTVLLLSKETLDVFRFWVVGSLSGSSGGALAELALYMGLGLLLALGVSRSLNAVALGDDTARALGTKLAATRLMTMAAVTLLLRRGGGGGRADRLCRADRAARGARLVRPRPALAARFIRRCSGHWCWSRATSSGAWCCRRARCRSGS